MPRDPQDATAAGMSEEKLSEESRKELYGRSEREQAPKDADRSRHTNTPSEEGAKDSGGRNRGS